MSGPAPGCAKAVELGAIIVTERGKPLVRLEAVLDVRPANPFRVRRARVAFVSYFDSSPRSTGRVRT